MTSLVVKLLFLVLEMKPVSSFDAGLTNIPKSNSLDGRLRALRAIIGLYAHKRKESVMADASVRGTIQATADRVWAFVRDFGGIADWFDPLVESRGVGSGVGMERICAFKDGVTITETLLELDEASRVLRYDVRDPNPLPMKNYVSKVQVKDRGDGTCEVVWSARFDADGSSDKEVTKMLEGNFKEGIDCLRKAVSAK